MRKWFRRYRMHNWMYVVLGTDGHEAHYSDTNNSPEDAIQDIENGYEQHFGQEGAVIEYWRINGQTDNSIG